MALLVTMLKYGLVAVSAGLWMFGLSDQLHSLDMTARYLVVSGALVAAAVF